MTISKKTYLAALIIGASFGAHAELFKADASSPFNYNKVGLETYNETYKEHVDGEKFMKSVAHMVGINMEKSWAITNNSGLKVKFNYAKGTSDYTGALMNEAYGSLHIYDTPRRRMDASLEYSMLWPEFNNIQTDLGVTHRILTDRTDKTFPEGGYMRKNTLDTFDFAVSKSYTYNDFKITPKFQGKILLSGLQQSYVASEPLEHKQRNGLGAGLEAEIKHTSKVSLTPYYKVMHLKDSETTLLQVGSTTYTTVEPENDTREVGIKVSYQF